MGSERSETMTVWQVCWQPLHTNDHMSGAWWEDRTVADWLAASIRRSGWVRNVTVQRLRVRVVDFLKEQKEDG